LSKTFKTLDMSEIAVSGRTKVKSFYNAFLKAYPYLHAALKYPDGKPVDTESTIANARQKSTSGNYTATGEADLSVRGNLKVSSFEKRFEENFSIKCIVHYKKNGKWGVTSAKHKAMTLSEANTALKADGCEEIKL
jgi:hypothetical protein